MIFQLVLATDYLCSKLDRVPINFLFVRICIRTLSFQHSLRDLLPSTLLGSFPRHRGKAELAQIYRRCFRGPNRSLIGHGIVCTVISFCRYIDALVESRRRDRGNKRSRILRFQLIWVQPCACPGS